MFGVADKESNQNQLNLKNIHVMCPLNEPDAGLIKLLETKLYTFSDEFGHFDDCQDKQVEADGSELISSNVNDLARSPLVEALWICHQEFKSIEKQAFAKRIFLFTDCDVPGSLTDQN